MLLSGTPNNLALPLVNRVFPALLSNQVVGVQPMSGPVGLAYALRAKYRDDSIFMKIMDKIRKDLGLEEGLKESGVIFSPYIPVITTVTKKY